MGEIEDLRDRWTELLSKSLPSAACSHDPGQSKWPVHVDHCFGRIILDNIVGEAKQPWMKVLKAPAVKNMNEEQLKACIEMAQQILGGQVDLLELDQISLSVRGKFDTKYKTDVDSKPNRGKKRKAGLSAEAVPNKSSKTQSELPFKPQSNSAKSAEVVNPSTLKESQSMLLGKIASDRRLTEYRKRLYSTLLSVPRGRYTTYAAMSEYLHSSARAVGSGMRNNPFAPEVPCHRVLAADGSIGGFCGDWGRDGQHASKKVNLLNEEGVKFDSRGKVIGPPFRALKDLSAA